MFNPKGLAKLLRELRRKGISRNSLAKATGISRRTLARIESGGNTPSPSKRSGDPERRPLGLSRRTAYKLAKALLGPEATQRALDDATRLSRFLGDDPLYKFLDVIYHYPAFLFHRSAAETLSAVEGPASFREYARDYAHSLDLLLRSGFGTRNLGARLRAFRLQHDLTLVETAALLDLSKSELHRLERAERRPSPRTRYRILRLLTLPLEGHDFSRAEKMLPLPMGEKAAGTQRPQRLGRAGKNVRVHQCSSVVPTLKALLSLPPPKPDARSSEPDPLDALRHHWLAGPLKTKELAHTLGVSQPHLIRLLRGDRNPGRKLREQLQVFVSRL